MYKALLWVSLALAMPTESLSAQTCAAPEVFRPNGGVPQASGTTCTGVSDDVVLYCGGQNSSGKNDAIYQITLTAGYTMTTIQLSGGAAGFDPVVYMYSASCSSGDGCLAAGDASNAMSVVGINPGTYFMAVSAAPPDSQGACGAYSLTSNGTPVSLQSFSIE